MNADEWKRAIRRATKAAGTYKKTFDAPIDALAKILEQRDSVYQEYLDGGAVPVVERVSDRGARNSAKNPLLTLWMELNRDALAYWRELGLTPSGLKRLNESAMASTKEQSALEKALASLA